MRIDTVFSEHLKAADLMGRNVPVTIARIEIKKIGDDTKPVLYFHGKEKGLVLNKTNANNISAIYGPETDTWTNQPIVLFPTMVDYQGRSVEAIRVRGPQPNGVAPPRQVAPAHPNAPPNYSSSQRPAPTGAPMPPAYVDDPLDDSIPF